MPKQRKSYENLLARGRRMLPFELSEAEYSAVAAAAAARGVSKARLVREALAAAAVLPPGTEPGNGQAKAA